MLAISSFTASLTYVFEATDRHFCPNYLSARIGTVLGSVYGRRCSMDNGNSLLRNLLHVRLRRDAWPLDAFTRRTERGSELSAVWRRLGICGAFRPSRPRSDGVIHCSPRYRLQIQQQRAIRRPGRFA